MIYETDGDENYAIEKPVPYLIAREHLCNSMFVVLEVDGVKHTVLADQLKRAIDNCTNAHSIKKQF